MKNAIKKAECHLICAARFLHISIPYDKDDEFSMITFDDGVMTELECEDGFIPPMLNKETERLNVTAHSFNGKPFPTSLISSRMAKSPNPLGPTYGIAQRMPSVMLWDINSTMKK